jgi:hypothetical protein
MGSRWGCIDLTDSGHGVKTQRSPHENTVIEAGYGLGVVAVTRKRKLFVAALAVVIFTAGAASYLYATRIPQVEQDPTTFWKQRGFEKVSVTSDLSWIIWRARADFRLFPTEVGSRELVLQDVYENSVLLYIVFRPVGTSHTAIVYAFAAPRRKALWKAQIAMD